MSRSRRRTLLWAGCTGAAAILLVGIGLLLAVSNNIDRNGASSRSLADVVPQPSGMQVPGTTRVGSPSFSSRGRQLRDVTERDNRVEESDAQYAKLVKDPEGAHRVLSFIGQDLGSPAAKVAAIRDTIVGSGTCSDSVCEKTKASLLARVEAAQSEAMHVNEIIGRSVALVSTNSSESVTHTPIECYQTGCLVQINVTGVPIQVLLARLQQKGQLDWPVPSIYSKPAITNQLNGKRTQSAMWVLFNPAS